MEDGYRYVHILLDILHKQKVILCKISEITDRQGKMADPSLFEERLFEETMEEKDVLIGELNELDSGFLSVYEHVRREVQMNRARYETELKDIQVLIKECTDLGVEIRVSEERNRTKLQNCFREKHREYGSQQTAVTAAARYRQTMRNGQVADSYFFNQKK